MRMLRAIAAGGAALAVAGVIGLTAEAAPAAPNPFGDRSATSEVSIAADGSYMVHLSQTQEMYQTYTASFGGVVHDGFRLPDDGTPIPPYLRVDYAAVSATVDGETVPFEREVTQHSVDLTYALELDEGDHRAELAYEVSGAAVPIDGGYAVYMQPLRGGTIVVTASDQISAVTCVTIPPEAEPCGSESADGWTVTGGELGPAGVVRVEITSAAVELIEPSIDNG